MSMTTFFFRWKKSQTIAMVTHDKEKYKNLIVSPNRGYTGFTIGINDAYAVVKECMIKDTNHVLNICITSTILDLVTEDKTLLSRGICPDLANDGLYGFRLYSSSRYRPIGVRKVFFRSCI